MSDQRALFERYPKLRNTLPFTPLGDFPTPVHRVTELEEAMGIEQLWIKRDDISASDYGGNKIRKLEFLLAAARQNNCTHVITYGGFGSNHALATAINCQKLGLKCVTILTPEPITDAVRQTLRYHRMLGTRIEIARAYHEANDIARSLHAELGTANCYEVPFGGSSWLGAVGFVNAAFELQQQINSGALDKPDRIYLGCGTAGSVAGLAVGLKLAGIEAAIEGVQVTPESMQPEKLYRSLFTEISKELHARDSSIPLLDANDAGVTVRLDQLGEGYAIPTKAAHVAANIMRENGGLPVSLTYTAKTLAALMADAGRGLIAGQNALFWNTYNSHKYPELPERDDWTHLPADMQELLAA